MRLALVASIAALVASPAAAQDQNDDIVVIGASGKPFRLSPEKLRGAVQAFEAHRAAMAPAATLIWRFRPTGSGAGVAVALRDGDAIIPISITPDGTFTLPHDKILSGHWRLTARPAHAGMAIAPLAHSPGSTPDLFRFGDARLQCETMMGFLLPDHNFIERGLVHAMGGCTAKSFSIYFGGEKPLANVAIDHWRGKVEMSKDGKAWRVPFYDRTIGNEDRVHIAYRP